MTFILYAWVSSFAYSFLAIFSKLASKQATSNPWLLNFTWTFISLLLLIPIALINNVGMPQEWLYLSLAAVCNAIWFILYSFSLYKVDVSVLSPLYSFQTMFAIILSVLFLDERLLPFQVLLIAVIFIAGVFVSLDEKFHIKSFFNGSVGILIIGMFFLALSRVFTNMTLQTNGLWESTLGIFAITTLVLTTTVPLFRNDVKKLTIKHATPLFLMSLSYVIGTVAAYEAFKTNVGISSLIISLPVTLLLVFALVWYKPNLLEKHSFKVYAIRFVAAVVMITSSLLLTKN